MNNILIVIGVMVALAAVLGVIVAVASKYLKVKEDGRREFLEPKLPGVNCGACGYPGCGGLVDALLSKKELNVSACKVLKKDKALELQKYLDEHPEPIE